MGADRIGDGWHQAHFGSNQAAQTLESLIGSLHCLVHVIV